jgi:hypothetical protein
MSRRRRPHQRASAGSTEARNVHADFCFGDFHLSAQIQDRDIRRCAPQLTFDGTLIVDMSKETPRPEKPSAMGLAATWAGNPTIFNHSQYSSRAPTLRLDENCHWLLATLI